MQELFRAIDAGQYDLFIGLFFGMVIGVQFYLWIENDINKLTRR